VIGSTDWFFVIFRLLHISAGVAWVGSVFFLVVFLQPSAAAIGPAAGPLMGQLLGARKLVDRIIVLGGITVVAGLVMYIKHAADAGLGTWLGSVYGFVLTIGMAVDTNILIFERIREEFRLGKTVRAAIDSGFQRAFTTVVDTHVTVVVSGIILYQFGTGPVKGFAVTLMIGIVASLFTAVFFTRLIFDLVYKGRRWRLQTLSI